MITRKETITTLTKQLFQQFQPEERLKFIGNIYMNLDFYVRVRAYEKRISGQQP